MPEIFLGIAALIGVLILLQVFLSTNPAALARAVRYAGAGILAVVAAALIYIRQFTFGFLAASMAWGLFTKGHLWPSAWPTRGFPFIWWFPTGGTYRGPRSSQRRGPQAGQTSSVSTAWIEIELNHDSGEMAGRILQGKHAGRALASLSPDDLIAFYADAGSADAETARLLEAYLDRRLGPEWRLKQQQQSSEQKHEAPRTSRDTGMSRDEAYSVLGLKTGASEDDIRAAHKRLMMQNHPDRGGTDYIAAKINEAKDVLLR
ncbi:MAG TPA: DnaJ domain-containing protein [Rhizomicrobium sp.]|jgi:hypothetical protein|nr:DnaJ domain-containing protein [Rhizomicrobium sp.]